eukprot:gene18311-24941_t
MHQITAKSYDSDTTSAFFGIGIFAVIGGAMLFFAFIEGRKVNRLKTGQIALDRLMKETTDPSSTKYFTATCPICLDDFPKTEMQQKSSEPYPTSGSPVSDENKAGSMADDDSVTSNKSITTTTHSSDPKRPMSLQCGHVFCYTCLKQYLKDKAQQGNA